MTRYRKYRDRVPRILLNLMEIVIPAKAGMTGLGGLGVLRFLESHNSPQPF